MMWKEFEELAGYEVSYSDYHNIIEPMYMAIPEGISKQEFIKMLDKKRFALPTKIEMVKEMRKIAKVIFEDCGRRSFHDEEHELERLSKAYAKRFYGIDWSHDIETYVFTTKLYGLYGTVVDRGCSFPHELVIGRKNTEYERITLAKI